jgi:nitrogen regulatory protein PII
VLGIDNDPEKEIILTVAGSEIAGSILELITQTASLNKPGNGFAFMIDIKNLLGIAHLLNLQHT